jgi:hypothetical protein
MLPESWLPPAEIQELRDRTRLRKALAQDRTRWAQRLHALLTQEGWPCQRERLLTGQGRRWAAALALPAASRAHVDLLLRLIEALEDEQRALERELARFARADRRCLALQTIFGVGRLTMLAGADTTQPQGREIDALPVPPGSRNAAPNGMSRRHCHPDQTSCAAPARAEIGPGQPAARRATDPSPANRSPPRHSWTIEAPFR